MLSHRLYLICPRVKLRKKSHDSESHSNSKTHVCRTRPGKHAHVESALGLAVQAVRGYQTAGINAVIVGRRIAKVETLRDQINRVMKAGTESSLWCYMAHCSINLFY